VWIAKVRKLIRKLIREMNNANPLWGAPRIHGEVLKHGISISPAAVAKYMVRRRFRPLLTGRIFLTIRPKVYRHHSTCS